MDGIGYWIKKSRERESRYNGCSIALAPLLAVLTLWLVLYLSL